MNNIKERGSVLYLGMGKEYFRVYHTGWILGKEATNPQSGQTKHADRMILPSSSQKYSRTYLRACGSQNKSLKKSRFGHVLSSYKPLVKDSLSTKPLRNLYYAKNDVFGVVLCLSSSVCKLATAAVLVSNEVFNTTPFWETLFDPQPIRNWIPLHCQT